MKNRDGQGKLIQDGARTNKSLTERAHKRGYDGSNQVNINEI